MESIHEFVSLVVGYVVYTVSNSGDGYKGLEPEDIVGECIDARCATPQDLSYLQNATLVLGEATTMLVNELKSELKAELTTEILRDLKAELKAELSAEILMEVGLEMEDLKETIKSAPARKSSIIQMEQFGYMANPLYGNKC